MVSAGRRDNHRVSVAPGPTRSETIEPSPTRPAFARLARAEDEPTLRRLRDQAMADLDAARGGVMYRERNATDLPPLAAAWSDADHRVWLGGLDGTEFGYLAASRAEVRSGATLGVIEAIFVQKDARACGIGEAMLAVALHWFAAMGCIGVESTALPGDRATKNFFEEHGLKARLITVYRSLQEPEPAAD
jgi:GNAT superfamily N-acetyltransferase